MVSKWGTPPLFPNFKKMSIFSPIFNCQKAGFEPQPRSKNGRSSRKYPGFCVVPTSDLEKKRPNFVEIILERNTKMRSDVRRMRGFSDRHTDEG